MATEPEETQTSTDATPRTTTGPGSSEAVAGIGAEADKSTTFENQSDEKIHEATNNATLNETENDTGDAKAAADSTSTSVTLHGGENEGEQSNGTGPGAETTNPGTGVIPAPVAPEELRSTFQTFIIMSCLCCAVFLSALDTTIITTALPTISGYFHSDAGYTWIGSAFLLANAASTPSWGKFSDIWGRKPILLAAASVFFVGSLLAGISVSIGMLIAARAIQGAGGGGLITLSNIAISDLFSMRNRGKYFGFIGMVWAFASAIGPLLGGVFTERVSWRWCFYINLPVTGCVWLGLFFFLHLDNPRTPVWDGLKAVDWLGSLTVVGGTLMFLLGLEFGGVTYPWGSPTVICLIIFGIVTFGLFILNEWKFARYPVIPLRIFAPRSNVAALAVCFCHGFVFISGSYYLPLYFQAVLGATPILSGVYGLPFALSLSITSALTGIYIKKTGKYIPPIILGLTLMTLGFGLYIDLDATANWPKLIIFQIIAGVGVGPNFQSPLIALQTQVAKRDIAAATATFGFVRNLSTSISVVIGAVLFQNQMQKMNPQLIAVLGPDLASQVSGGSAGASVALVQSLPGPQQVIVRQAFYESLRDMWIMYVAFALLGLFASMFIVSTALTKDHEVTKTGLAEEEAKRKEEEARRRAAKELKHGANGSGEKISEAV